MEATMDRHGTLHFRAVTRGGIQIESRLYTDHAHRVIEAWRAQETEKLYRADVRVLPMRSRRLRKVHG